VQLHRPFLLLGAITGVVALAGLIGFLLPRELDSTATVTIARPPEMAWQFLYDRGNLPTWTPEFVKVEILPGNRWKGIGRDGSSALFEDVAVEPPRRLVSKMIAPDQSIGGWWRIEVIPQPGGCRVTAHTTLEIPNPIQRFLARLLFNGDKEEAKSLELLKRGVEAK